LLNRVGAYGKARGVRLPSLKRVISAGAPVMPKVLDQFAGLLRGEAEIYTGYGATEAMPVASIGSREILSETRSVSEGGRGVCVGKPIQGIDVRIIEISDGPIETWSPDLPVAAETVGEIAVRGDIVTSQYYSRPEADALAKIRDGDTVWHRMGDLGRMDPKGRIWFYGRKSQRVMTDAGTLFTIACEAIFNTHPRVFRSALVGVGSKPCQKPVMCIELYPDDDGSRKALLSRELMDLAQSTAWTRSIDTFLYHDGFPVDIRHNSKIFREKLARWAEKKLK
jgi:acyl-CoA synthetase (AMP-forming)/AMP-acid ligase II